MEERAIEEPTEEFEKRGIKSARTGLEFVEKLVLEEFGTYSFWIFRLGERNCKVLKVFQLESVG